MSLKKIKELFNAPEYSPAEDKDRARLERAKKLRLDPNLTDEAITFVEGSISDARRRLASAKLRGEDEYEAERQRILEENKDRLSRPDFYPIHEREGAKAVYRDIKSVASKPYAAIHGLGESLVGEEGYPLLKKKLEDPVTTEQELAAQQHPIYRAAGNVVGDIAQIVGAGKIIKPLAQKVLKKKASERLAEEAAKKITKASIAKGMAKGAGVGAAESAAIGAGLEAKEQAAEKALGGEFDGGDVAREGVLWGAIGAPMGAAGSLVKTIPALSGMAAEKKAYGFALQDIEGLTPGEMLSVAEKRATPMGARLIYQRIPGSPLPVAEGGDPLKESAAHLVMQKINPKHAAGRKLTEKEIEGLNLEVLPPTFASGALPVGQAKGAGALEVSARKWFARGGIAPEIKEAEKLSYGQRALINELDRMDKYLWDKNANSLPDYARKLFFDAHEGRADASVLPDNLRPYLDVLSREPSFGGTRLSFVKDEEVLATRTGTLMSDAAVEIESVMEQIKNARKAIQKTGTEDVLEGGAMSAQEAAELEAQLMPAYDFWSTFYARLSRMDPEKSLEENIGWSSELKEQMTSIVKPGGMSPETENWRAIMDGVRMHKIARMKIDARHAMAMDELRRLGVDTDFMSSIYDYEKRAYKLFEDAGWQQNEPLIDKFADYIISKITSVQGRRELIKDNPELGKLTAGRVMGVRPRQVLGSPSKGVPANEKYKAEYKEAIKSHLRAWVSYTRQGRFAPQPEPSIKGIKGLSGEMLESRRDLSPEYREFLGQYQDPYLRYKITQGKLSEIYLRAYHLNELAKIPGLFMSEADLAAHTAAKDFPMIDKFVSEPRIKLPETEGWGKLAGKMTTGYRGADEKLSKALIQEVLYGPVMGFLNSGFATWGDSWNRMWKYMHTVANVYTHPRNAIGNITTSALAGSVPYFSKKNGAKPMSIVLPDARDYFMGRMPKSSYWKEYLERGMLETSEVQKTELAAAYAWAAEREEGVAGLNKAFEKMAMDMLRDPIKNGASSQVFQNAEMIAKQMEQESPGITQKLMDAVSNIPRTAGKAMEMTGPAFYDWMQSFKFTQGLNRLYNLEDVLFKYHYYVDQRMSGTGVEEAIKNVDRFFPNYRDVPLAVHLLRKVPLGGPFISFKAEMGRVLFENFKVAAEDLAKGDPSRAARFIAALSYPNMMQRSLASAQGIGDEDLKRWNDNASIYNRNSLYMIDPKTNEPLGLVVGNYTPHADLLDLYENVSGAAKGLLGMEGGRDIQSAWDNILENAWGFEDYWLAQLAVASITGQTEQSQQMVFDKDLAPLMAFDDKTLGMTPGWAKENLAFGGRFGGAKIPELAAYIGGQQYLPSQFQPYFWDRMARIKRMYDAGRIDLDGLAAQSGGIRVFKPDVQHVTARKLGGKVTKKRTELGIEQDFEGFHDMAMKKRSHKAKMAAYKKKRALEAMGFDTYNLDTIPSEEQPPEGNPTPEADKQ